MARRRTGAAWGPAGLVTLVIGGVIGAVIGAAWLMLGRPQAPLPLQSSPTAAPSLPPHAPPPPPWTTAQLQELLGAASHADAEGLRASDYRVDALRAAVDGQRTGPDVDALADKAALALAHDYAAGRIRNRHRFNWFIDDTGPAPAEMARRIVAARAQGRLRDWLDGLLPAGDEYRALRDALAATPDDDADRRDRIKANLERWRWLPRGFGGGDQLYVNLPTYRLDVVQDGERVATYRAVIGATDMPTPALSVPVRQVIANPDWIVPQSIVRRSHLRPGASSRYIFTTRPDGTVRVRQKPGPGNALGRVKIVFPNPLAIYFHDTPSKSLFGASTRAFSHGCVRVQGIETLAASLVASPDRFATALAGTQTRGFKTARQWRASIVYLTLVPGADGTLADVGDPYKLDEPLAAALEGRKPRAPAPAPLSPPPVAEPQAAPPADMAAPPAADPDDSTINGATINGALLNTAATAPAGNTQE